MGSCILVVEDQEDNRQILRDLLGNAGYELIEAENGEQALAASTKRRPDLIVMDIQLPIMDGYEATRRIRANPEMKTIPIITVTSYTLAGDEAIQLSSRKRCRKAVTNGLQTVGVVAPKKPMVGSLRGCCACAASGNAAAVPPTNAMNSRRLMAPPAPRTTEYHISGSRTVPFVTPKRGRPCPSEGDRTGISQILA
jgi:two-component system cell cycle response regulator DivK